jgi:hypothetical protein
VSVRAQALTDHRVPDFRDDAAVISSLSASLPACLAVEQYWRANGADHVENTNISWYVTRIHNPAEGEFLRYHSPGGFSIAFGEKAAIIGGPCRWSGFCTIAELQAVHATAFGAIARALGGTTIALTHDCEDLINEAALYDGASAHDCIAMLQTKLGPPQPSLAIFSDDVETFYRRIPRPWYLLPNRR